MSENKITPNFGELTVFYSHGNQQLPNPFGFKSASNSGLAINAILDSHIKSPCNIETVLSPFGISMI
jgi:hypothetical protein